jgi:hypothetical protein
MKVIEATVVRSRADGNVHLCRIGVLDRSDRERLLAVQREGLGDLMFPLQPNEIDAMLDGGGRIVGATVGGDLVAFMAILIPGRTDANLGHDFGLPADELDQVAHWTAVVVDPRFRGNRLQRRLIAATTASVLRPEHFRYWFATARVANIASTRNFLAAGLRIFKMAPRYDGFDRYFFYRDFEHRSAAPATAIACPMRDHDGHRRLLADGYIAVAHEVAGDKLIFARRIFASTAKPSVTL